MTPVPPLSLLVMRVTGNAGNGAGAGPGRGFPPAGCDDDFDDGHFEWLVRELDAGRLLPQPESAIEDPAVSVSLGDACDVDPELLAAVCGPDRLGGQAAGAAFGEGRVSRVIPESGSQAVSRVIPESGSQAVSLTDDELAGVLQATRRLANLASWQQTVVIAECARRRQAEFEAARARGGPERGVPRRGTGDGTSRLRPVHCRADRHRDRADHPAARTLAGMADGRINLVRACAIAARTRAMTDADAAWADAVLAEAAPGLPRSPGTLRRDADCREGTAEGVFPVADRADACRVPGVVG